MGQVGSAESGDGEQQVDHNGLKKLRAIRCRVLSIRGEEVRGGEGREIRKYEQATISKREGEKVKLYKLIDKWHILNTKYRRLDETREEPTTRRLFLLLLYARTAARLPSTTAYVPSVVSTAASWPSRRRLRNRPPQISCLSPLWCEAFLLTLKSIHYV